jgi:CBS domain-containing protein
MGPVVSLGIAAILFLLLKLTGQSLRLEHVNAWTTASFVERLMLANLILAAFNLLPAFPMDGGRIFRALLARHVGFARATRMAARVGHTVAVLFGLLGLYSNPFLVIIAVFVWVGASQEAAMVQMKSAFAGILVSRVTLTDITSISASDPLRKAVELVLHGTQQDFPVIENGRLAGILTNKELLHGLSQHGPDTPVSEVMLRDFCSVGPSDSLQSALEQLQTTRARVLPVVDRDRFLGLVTVDALAEFMMLQSALQQEGRTSPAGNSASSMHRPGDQERGPRLIA